LKKENTAKKMEGKEGHARASKKTKKHSGEKLIYMGSKPGSKGSTKK